MTAQIVDAIAHKLADPHDVTLAGSRPGSALYLRTGDRTPWQPIGLADAHPGVALLFTELGTTDPDQRTHVQAHLAAGLAAEVMAPLPALYGGTVALAFAAHAAALAFGGYWTLLSQLDRAIIEQALQRAGTDRARVARGRPIGDWCGYDVISGGAGFGRYLLARYQLTADATVCDALGEVLATLVEVALAEDVLVEGRRVPAWWVMHDVAAGGVRGSGHLNLGLAHGIGGPLALLALAWTAGVRVDGQEEAMRRIVALLDELRQEDLAGPYWPHWVTLDPDAESPRLRGVWSDGAAGLARAIFLAGVALDEKEWQDTAHAALRGALLVIRDDTIHDFALCAGWAGLLQITWRMAYDTGDPLYVKAADRLATRIHEGFDPDAMFGFRYTGTPETTDRPGLLEGAAGIALALHCHATGEPPATNWDAALLIN